jgi:hypothetical protein
MVFDANDKEKELAETRTKNYLLMQLISVVPTPGEAEISCLCPSPLFLGVMFAIPSLS